MVLLLAAAAAAVVACAAAGALVLVRILGELGKWSTRQRLGVRQGYAVVAFFHPYW
jgi:hypothetical protein